MFQRRAPFKEAIIIYAKMVEEPRRGRSTAAELPNLRGNCTLLLVFVMHEIVPTVNHSSTPHHTTAFIFRAQFRAAFPS